MIVFSYTHEQTLKFVHNEWEKLMYIARKYFLSFINIKNTTLSLFYRNMN